MKQPAKHQRVSATEEDKKQFVLQKNGGFALTLLKNKNMVLRLFKGNVCVHIFGITETKSMYPSTAMNLLVCWQTGLQLEKLQNY